MPCYARAMFYILMHIIGVHSSTHTHTVFNVSQNQRFATRCFLEALDQDLHITLTQSFKEPICKHECHGVTIFGIVAWEKKRTKYWKKALIPHMVQGRALWCPNCLAFLFASIYIGFLCPKKTNKMTTSTKRRFFFWRIVLLRPLRRAITRMLEAHIRIEISWVVSSCRSGEPKDTLAEQLLAQTADDEAALDGSRKKCSNCWFISILWRSFASSHFCHNFRPFQVIHFVGGQIPRARRVTLSVWQPRCWSVKVTKHNVNDVMVGDWWFNVCSFFDVWYLTSDIFRRFFGWTPQSQEWRW